MAAPRAAWGIEIGADALKAIRLERDGDSVRVADFAYLPHKKSLVDPEADPDDSVRITLGQFMSQKDLEGEHVVMSVPGHEAFARFAKLPPVEAKKVPDIVKFEAVQQIPFPIEEVEWDYEVFRRDDAAETEVGIFAIKRDKVEHRLDLYRDVSLVPESLTLSPIALFNAMSHDLDLGDREDPVVILDIGSQSTDVVIAEGGRCWIRTFPLGGNDFTEAIKETFKLGHGKADKLKREASTSKYAKQIMQAMRPVFSDLLQDLQRSLSYYRQMSRDAELTEMIGVGSTFKIPGLRKFIGQQLEINVTRLDEFKKIQVTGREASSFAEHAVNMATAYGLALQGVGMGRIDANLVPVGSLRESLWAQKTKWFAAAAAVVVAGASTTMYHPLVDGAAISDTVDPRVQTTIRNAKSLQSQLQEVQSAPGAGYRGTNMVRLLDHRDIWPQIIDDATNALASSTPLPAERDSDPTIRATVPAGEARLIRMQSLDASYVPPTGVGTAATPRSFEVSIQVLLTHDDPVEFLTDTVGVWLNENAERSGVPYRIVADSISVNPGSIVTTEADADGRLPGDFGGTRPEGGSGGGGGGGGTMPGAGAPSGGGGAPNAAGGGTRRAGGGGRAAPGAGVGGANPSGGGPSMGGAGRFRPGASGGRSAPGAGVGGGDPRGGGNNFPGPTRTPGGGGNQNSGAARGGDAPDAPNLDLDQIAPLAPPPPSWPAGENVHGGVVTFTIELLPPGADASDLASAGTAGGENRS